MLPEKIVANLIDHDLLSFLLVAPYQLSLIMCRKMRGSI